MRCCGRAAGSYAAASFRAVMRMRVAFLGPAGTFSEDALRAAAAATPTSMPQPRRASTRRSAPSPRARSIARWSRSRTRSRGRCAPRLDTLAFEAVGVTIAGEHDHPIRNSLIARTELPLERIEVVLSHPQASAQCARFIREELPERHGAGSREHRRGGPRGVGVRASPGPRSAPPRRRGSTAAWCCARGSRTTRTTSPASSGSPRPGPRSPGRAPGGPPSSSPSWARTIPGALVEALDRVLEPRRQPDPDRVTAAAPGTRALHVLPRSRGPASGPGGRRGDRGAAGQGRIGADPGDLPDRGETAIPGPERTGSARPDWAVYNRGAMDTAADALM